MPDDAEIIELIRRAKLEDDAMAKNKLLAKYYEDGCKWAKGKIKKILYTDMINPSNDEIASMVYQSFEKSIKTIKIGGDNRMSFKTYFYWMIQYQIYAEIKTTLNYRIIPNYRREVNFLIREMQDICGVDVHQINKTIIDHSLWEIIHFLEEKNADYAKIVILKSKGYKPKDICREMNISNMALKSKVQYIKKLIRSNFDHPLSNF